LIANRVRSASDAEELMPSITGCDYWLMPGHVCHAGRSAFFGGRWQEPCPNYARHYIASPESDPIVLCDGHFEQVNEAGQVKEPYLDPQDYERREQQRVGEHSKRHRWFLRN
jgi:hypothetical protein